jgi:hypothetical protein
VVASGSDIWNNADHFHYYYKQMTGNFDVSVHVSNITNTDYWAKAGIMVRQSLVAGSPEEMVALTPHNETEFQWRDTANQGSNSIDAGLGTGGGWVRLVRSGNLFTAYWSIDGQNWKQIGTHTTTMTHPVYLGLAVTAHNNDGRLNTSTFGNLTITPTPGPSSPQIASGSGSSSSAGGNGSSGASTAGTSNGAAPQVAPAVTTLTGASPVTALSAAAPTAGGAGSSSLLGILDQMFMNLENELQQLITGEFHMIESLLANLTKNAGTGLKV